MNVMKPSKKGVGTEYIVYFVLGLLVLFIVVYFIQNRFTNVEDDVDDVTNPNTLNTLAHQQNQEDNEGFDESLSDAELTEQLGSSGATT